MTLPLAEFAFPGPVRGRRLYRAPRRARPPSRGTAGRRTPGSGVDYRVADLLGPPAQFARAFDLRFSRAAG
jgi:hypothetical protein